MIEKQESKLKSKLMEAIKVHLPNFVAIRHEDVRTNGIPDLSLTGFGRTTWWEFKHGTPGFKSQGIQELTMLRLAGAGFARYVIWRENSDGSNKETLIVHPRDIKSVLPEDSAIGYDFVKLTEFMKRVHRP